ncbi:MAG: VCBS repeat-containing protein [Lentisphaerae bacterium]|nr:VCBS repeat-containing protein [Lentisphaerota bacterium]
MRVQGVRGAGVWLVLGVLGVVGAENLRAQTYTGPVFPADNIWNTPVDALPVDANSAAYVNTIGATRGVHADFGSGTWNGGPIGIPFTSVPGTQPRVPITFYYPDESDPGPYPIPPTVPIEGGPQSGGDRHILIIDRDRQVLYEVYDAHPQPDGSWQAGSGAIFDLNSNALRPAEWTSADAAGLPIYPGLVRYDDVAAGEIRHAIRFTAPQTRHAYAWPARHQASSLTGTQYPPMGQRFRLKASYNISGFSPAVQVILRAMKTYGIILADNGSSWFISGAPDSRWNDEVLHELARVTGGDFEAVNCAGLMVTPNSGQVRGGGTGVQPPQGVSATRGTYDDRVALGWQRPAGATSVSLWRHTGADVAGAVVRAANVTEAGFTDTAVEPGLSYFYWLKANYASATSGLSAPVVGYVSSPQAAYGDFDGDGRSDETLYHEAAGRWRIRLSGGGPDGERAFGGIGMAGAPGDFDGDGRVDLGVYVSASGEWYVRPSTGGADYHVTVAAGGVPVPGDYDGDGRCDMATYRLDTGRWEIRASRAAPPITGATFGLGGLGHQAVPADYDADGRADAAVYNRLTHAWTILFSGGGSSVQTWGGANTFGVPADYDGDAHADLAVFNRVTGNWWVLDSATGLPHFQAGNRTLGLRPVPGDYDADGTADFAAYVSARKTWYHRRSQDGRIIGPIAWSATGFDAVTPWR